MSTRDELQELWVGEPPRADTAEELLAVVKGKTWRFDSMITSRNLIECVAAIFVVLFFARHALLGAENGLSRAGGLLVAAGAAWILYYVLRYGRGPATPDPSQDLASYTNALLARYDHQIHLLRSVKYWYLLPMYVGLLVVSAGGFVDRVGSGTLGLRDLAGPAVYTTVFAIVWWLNEVKAVGRLRQERARLLSMMAGASDPSEEAE